MPIGSQEGLDINAAVVTEQGLNTLASEAQATEGQVPTVGSDGKVGFAAGGSQTLMLNSTTISAADWAAFASDPSPFNNGYGFTLIDSPGSGKYIYPIAASLLFIPGTTPYTLDAGASSLGSPVLQLGTPQMNDESARWLERDAGSLEEVVTTVKPMFFKDQVPNFERTWIEDESLLLIIAMPAPTDGDGALRVDTFYAIIDLP